MQRWMGKGLAAKQCLDPDDLTDRGFVVPACRVKIYQVC